MMTNGPFLLLQKLDKRCFLSCSDNKMAFGNMVCRVGSDHLAKHKMADIHDLMVLISVGSVLNYGHISCTYYINLKYLMSGCNVIFAHTSFQVMNILIVTNELLK
jgi:hypothetical protein